jgi:hypothetical protein
MFGGKEVVVVHLKINVNLKALTIEETIAKRKFAQAVTVENLLKEVRFEANLLQLGLGEDAVSAALQPLRDLHSATSREAASWFNVDENLRAHLNRALDLKRGVMLALLTGWCSARDDPARFEESLLRMLRRDKVALARCRFDHRRLTTDRRLTISGQPRFIVWRSLIASG